LGHRSADSIGESIFFSRAVEGTAAGCSPHASDSLLESPEKIEADDENEIGSALFRHRPIVAGLVGLVVPGHFRVLGFRAKGKRFHLFFAAERDRLSFFDCDLAVAFPAFIDEFAHVPSPSTSLNVHCGIKLS
jgi:hypothetical protein